jgi:hypothetical protein
MAEDEELGGDMVTVSSLTGRTVKPLPWVLMTAMG